MFRRVAPLFQAMSVLGLFAICGTAPAQPAACPPDGATRCYGLPAIVSGVYPAIEPIFGPPVTPRNTYPLNQLPWIGVAPPDFPPRSLDPVAGSYPLVPREQAASLGPRRFAERPALAGIVDLITGAPLLQEVDFELPFGGAVFRHVRTSSDNVTTPSRLFTLAGDGIATDGYTLAPEAMFWDWQGQNWMMGESPLLLIDARYRWGPYPAAPVWLSGGGIIADYTVSYFIPDAHHAVPFVKNDATGLYSAPAWFDARMWGSPQNADIYHISLAGGALIYTFEKQVDDVPVIVRREAPGTPCPDSFSDGTATYCRFDGHAAPEWLLQGDHVAPWGGEGIPYYALLKEISDRYGNRVVIHTVPRRSGDCGHGPADADRCCQNCHQIGQIETIELIPAGATAPEWTLLYTYRPFRSRAPGMDGYPTAPEPGATPPELHHLWHQSVLHSIHIYEGAASATPPPAGPTEPFDRGPMLPASAFYGDATTPPIGSFDEYDAIDEEALCGLPANWHTRVEYVYQEPDIAVYRASTAGAQYRVAGRQLAPPCGAAIAPENALTNLLKATVTRRGADGALTETNATLYFYNRYTNEYGTLGNGGAGVRTVVSARNLATMLTAGGMLHLFAPPACNEPAAIPLDSVNAILAAGPYATWTPEDGDPQSVQTTEWTADIAMHNAAPQWWGARVPQIAQSLDLPSPYWRHDDRHRHVVSDRRVGRRLYVLTRFTVFPECPSAPAGSCVTNTSGVFWADAAIFHYPYRYLQTLDGTEALGLFPLTLTQVRNPMFASAPWDWPFHMTVVDEYEDAAAAWVHPQGLRPSRRRVVEMNIAGFVLRDRTWDFGAGDPPAVVTNSGYGESRVRDQYGRIAQVRSSGWGSAGGHDPQSDGLVVEYEYVADAAADLPEPDYATRLTRLKAGVGAAQPAFYVEREDYARVGGRIVTTRSVKFRTPTTDPNDPDAEVTVFEHEFFENNGDRGLRSLRVTQPAARASELDDALFHPATIQIFDAQGRAEWSGAGLVPAAGAAMPSPGFYWQHTAHDSRGRVTSQTIDCADGPGGTAPPRLAADGLLQTPLEHTTEYVYSEPFGVQRVESPNGRRAYFLYDTDSGPLGSVLQYIYRDVADDVALSPVEVNELRGGQLVKAWKVKLDGPVADPPARFPLAVADIVSETTPQYDETGRLVGVSYEGAGVTSPLSARIHYHATGQIERQQAPDGTITRHEYDERGRMLRAFRGTTDYHAYWGAPPAGEGGNPPYHDNLVLIEKRYYGTGVTNAGLLTRVRNYGGRPDNQYFDPAVPNDPNPPPPNNEDELGWVEDTEYDWRMRPVWSTRRLQEPTGPPAAEARHTATWYDNLDRVRFVAEYSGAGVSLGAVDPRAAVPGASEPTAADILSASPAPLRLTETIYNRRGQAEEIRTYDVTTSAEPHYTSTITYYDHAGRALETAAPDSPLRCNVYDAKGRLVTTETIAAGYVITRTETTYDTDDRAIASLSRERLADNTLSPAILDATNSVATYVHSWYDLAGRLIASANYGAHAATFTSTSVAPPRPADPPGASTPQMLVTRYEYDSLGRQTAVYQPDGTVTRSEYDGLGRLRLTRENADQARDTAVRITAYDYDEQGRLARVAAVLPAHGAVDSFDDINWSAADGSLQVTRLQYGAEVWNRDGVPESRHNGWVAAVLYPHPNTGQPGGSVLTFAYSFDGSVIRRSDSRGLDLLHSYDDRGRRVETRAGRLWWTGEPGFALVQPQLLSRVAYEYDGQDRLVCATAWEQADNSEAIVTQNVFQYDSRGNLLREWQEHGAAVTAGTPYIEYERQYVPQNAGLPPNATRNFDRLVRIQYPQVFPFSPVVDIALEYGQPAAAIGPIDEALGRVTGIRVSTLGSEPIASYTYGGLARRVDRRLGNGISQRVVAAAGDGYDGLDGFGRLMDLHWTLDATGATLHRYQYGYDLNGNRTSARATHWPTQGQTLGVLIPHENDRSYHYTYDALQRLVAAELGSLNTTNTAVEPSAVVPVPRTVDWALDVLGNWSAGSGSPPASVTVVSPPHVAGGAAVVTSQHHVVDDFNAITEVQTFGTEYPTPVSTAYVNDPCGNLAFDGTYYYQYDAWNRLVQVNRLGSATLDPLGRVVAGELGELVAAYQYDALGRLVVKRTPVTPGEPAERREEYYYDGVQRVCEVVDRPGAVVLEPQTELPPGALSGLEPTVEVTPLDPLGFNVVAAVPQVWQQRQYVWGPAYVDELVLELDGRGEPIWVHQDANWDVVALTSRPGVGQPGEAGVPEGGGSGGGGGAGGGGGGGGSGGGAGALPAVLAQFVYDPYGDVLVADHLIAFSEADPPPGVLPTPDYLRSPVGSQGRFFERFERDPNKPVLVSDAVGLYVQRNRHPRPLPAQRRTDHHQRPQLPPQGPRRKDHPGVHARRQKRAGLHRRGEMNIMHTTGRF